MDQKSSPVDWARFLCELEDARDHLGNLIEQIAKAGEFEEEDFGIQFGHIYSHLNRAWHSRGYVGEVTKELWVQNSQYPCDLKPLG